MSPTCSEVVSTGSTVQSWPESILPCIELPRGRKCTVSPAWSRAMCPDAHPILPSPSGAREPANVQARALSLAPPPLRFGREQTDMEPYSHGRAAVARPVRLPPGLRPCSDCISNATIELQLRRYIESRVGGPEQSLRRLRL